ncbi:MAG: hypothetical protein GXC76_11295 [Rhodanobacteraceae bacterium]|jgi:nitrogen fixation-related uncharacterized protein|nr:hypothetical protein [Rhodanobacteraceae bacterium]
MNEMSLSRLYRRLALARPAPAVDAAELVDALAGEAPCETIATQLAASPAHADLARMLRALQADSEALAADVTATRRGAHPLRPRSVRHHAAAPRRVAHPLRWAGGLAACLAVALGVVGIWHGERAKQWDDVAAASQSVVRPDRIFTTRDRIFASAEPAGAHASGHGGDELFRGGFGS